MSRKKRTRKETNNKKIKQEGREGGRAEGIKDSPFAFFFFFFPSGRRGDWTSLLHSVNPPGPTDSQPIAGTYMPQ